MASLKTDIAHEKSQKFTLAITGIKPKIKLVLNLILSDIIVNIPRPVLKVL